jgi:hypothetical protein
MASLSKSKIIAHREYPIPLKLSWLEQRTHNPLVPGSSPGGPTRNENTNLRVGIFFPKLVIY